MWNLILWWPALALGNRNIRLIECFLSMFFGLFGMLKMHTSLKVSPQMLFLLLKSVQQERLNLESAKNRTAKNNTSKNNSLANEHFGHLG